MIVGTFRPPDLLRVVGAGRLKTGERCVERLTLWYPVA